MPAPNPSELDPRVVAELKQAFHGSDAAKVREILARFPELKPHINAPVGPFDSPAITHARSREMLDVLLDAGADINAKSQWWAGGFGLLHGCDPELATYAIQRGAIVDAHAAARLGLLDKLRELLRADPELVRARGGDGQTPLHFASTIEIADLLLDHGADIDARDVDHESTPVQWMIGDRTAIARHLVQRGCRMADPECIRIRVTADHFAMINPKAGGTIYQWTLGWYVSPHEVARKFGHEDIYQILMDRSPVEVRLLAACWASDEPAVQALLGANPGLISRLSEADRRHVALAARNNNTAAVRVMLAAGWPVDALGQHRATPLHWAAFHGNAEMAREILRHQPPLEVTDADFNATPLGWAIHGSEHGWYCRTGNYAGTVEALLQAGAKLGDRKLAGTAAVQEVLRRHAAAS